jgi:hypothetical protein
MLFMTVQGKKYNNDWTTQRGLYISKEYHLVQSFAVTVEPGYNDIGPYNTSLIASNILWYQLIPHC